MRHEGHETEMMIMMTMMGRKTCSSRKIVSFNRVISSETCSHFVPKGDISGRIITCLSFCRHHQRHNSLSLSPCFASSSPSLSYVTKLKLHNVYQVHRELSLRSPFSVLFSSLFSVKTSTKILKQQNIKRSKKIKKEKKKKKLLTELLAEVENSKAKSNEKTRKKKRQSLKWTEKIEKESITKGKR